MYLGIMPKFSPTQLSTNQKDVSFTAGPKKMLIVAKEAFQNDEITVAEVTHIENIARCLKKIKKTVKKGLPTNHNLDKLKLKLEGENSIPDEIKDVNAHLYYINKNISKNGRVNLDRIAEYLMEMNKDGDAIAKGKMTNGQYAKYILEKLGIKKTDYIKVSF